MACAADGCGYARRKGANPATDPDPKEPPTR